VAIQRYGFSAARMMHSYVRDNADRIFICATAPASFSAASTQPSKIVSANATAGDWTIASGANGPEMVFGQRTVTVEGSGSASHLVFARSSGSTILVVTDCCGTTTLASGDSVTIPAWLIASDFGEAMAVTRPTMIHNGLSVLIEHNLIRNPINVGATAGGEWRSVNGVVVHVSATAGPPGITQDVAKLMLTNQSVNHIWVNSARSALVSGDVYRTEIKIKSGDGSAFGATFVGIRTTDMEAGTPTTWVNTTTWTLSNVTHASSDITQLSTDWYRVRAWSTASSSTTPQVRILFSSAASDQTMTGNNTTGHYFTDAMLVRELGG
jgi:hypothetical protein